MRTFVPMLAIALLAVATAFRCVGAWVLVSNSGELTMLGSITIDPSSGLPASLALKSNATDVWRIGNHPWSSKIFGQNDVFSISNVNGA